MHLGLQKMSLENICERKMNCDFGQWPVWWMGNREFSEFHFAEHSWRGCTAAIL